MSEELNNQPKVEIANPHHVRDCYIAVPGPSVVPEFKWLWDDEERCFKYVQVGEKDFSAIVAASGGQDIASIIARQPGETAFDKFENAVAAGLVQGPDGDPFAADYSAPVVDGSFPAQDAMEGQLKYREGLRQVDRLNEALGRGANNSFSADDFLAGKADAIIKEYLEKRIAAAQPAEGENK